MAALIVPAAGGDERALIVVPCLWGGSQDLVAGGGFDFGLVGAVAAPAVCFPPTFSVGRSAAVPDPWVRGARRSELVLAVGSGDLQPCVTAILLFLRLL